LNFFSPGVTAEVLRANICSKLAILFQRGLVDPKILGQPAKIIGRRGRPTSHSSQKTRLNDFLYGIKICTDFSSVLSQSTGLTDRQMDRILIARLRLHSMHRGKNWNLM